MKFINLTGEIIEVMSRDGDVTMIIRPTNKVSKTKYSYEMKTINDIIFKKKVAVDITNIPEKEDGEELYIVNESVFLKTTASNIITPEYYEEEDDDNDKVAEDNKKVAMGFRVHNFKYFKKSNYKELNYED